MASLAEKQESSAGLSLAVRLQGDSSQAWRECVELYGPLVESWSTAAGLPPAARADVAQEVFLSVHRGIRNFDPTIPGATFRGWLWRITRNEVLKTLARVKSAPQARGGSTANVQLADIPEPWPDASECEPPPDLSETSLLIRRAMEQIQAKVEHKTWKAFWSTAVLGQSTSQVAIDLNMTKAAVRKAKSRTLHRLRQQLGDHP